MSKKKRNTLQKKYEERAKKIRPRRPIGRNFLAAYFVGGLIAVIGQLLIMFYVRVGLTQEIAGTAMIATLILLAAILTGIGVWDRVADFAGAGAMVPVTGFANSIVASALEFRREGLVLGVGSRMFQLAGSVITFGAVTAFFVGLITAIVKG